MSNPPMYGESAAAGPRSPQEPEAGHRPRPSSPRTADQNSVFLPPSSSVTPARNTRSCSCAPACGADGKPVVAPLAVIGLRRAPTCSSTATSGLGNYVPAYLRRYPFAMARIDGAQRHRRLLRHQWPAFNETTGELAVQGRPADRVPAERQDLPRELRAGSRAHPPDLQPAGRAGPAAGHALRSHAAQRREVRRRRLPGCRREEATPSCRTTRCCTCTATASSR